jgi:hypothetical protein
MGGFSTMGILMKFSTWNLYWTYLGYLNFASYSSVSLVTRLRIGRPGSITGRGRDFISSLKLALEPT